MFVYIILVLNCFISNMVVGVFGEARGAYSRPALDLMVLERIQSLQLLCPHPTLSPTSPFLSPLSYLKNWIAWLFCVLLFLLFFHLCVMIFIVLSFMCYDFYCYFILGPFLSILRPTLSLSSASFFLLHSYYWFLSFWKSQLSLRH